MVSKRESNFELMRVVAMAMIVLHHVVVHCVYPQLTDGALMAKWNNGWFCNPKFYPQLLIPEALAPLGKTGVVLFMLLSGYFSVERGRDARVGRRLGKLLGQVGFATLAVMAASFLYYRHIDTYVPVLLLNLFNDVWWFVGFYALIVALGAAFLNSLLNGLSREAYLAALAGGFAIAALSWSGALLDNLASGLRTLLAGVVCYAGGGFIRKYDPLRRLRVSTLFIILLAVYALMAFSYRDAVMTTSDGYLQGDQSALYLQATGTNSYEVYSLAPMLMGVAIFELFRRVKLRSSRLVNGLASATFMIYLIHDNEFMRAVWKHGSDLVTPLYRSPLRFCLTLALRLGAVFALGLAAYLVYRGLLWALGRLKRAFVKPE